ncbi:hypothetical protein ASPACDRAFT_39474 [Aspergillus aculeatus ATCC 16872]|uniref:alcohol dehydrogenase n=1 Tax=Aspergillus aculeatus (strain ATCC 16872 / CBS 172.66 / WB 5094) TaxID=690307 RepID=A0A1L9X5X6_ASPA1|nr:uncharacterized protein ASPACDRAFT_39474 [Aspergillus aculeatus ATCC 16872]OJK03855.1 hypothetical protein ASPACDRAFT_39474 [Aspergillus aculeatus ATCC 16872]
MVEQPVAILKKQGADFTFTITTATIPTIQSREILVCLEVAGHEGIGRIVAVGAMCEAKAAVVGQRVGIGWIRDACGACPNCMSAEAGETRCTTQVFSGRDVAGTLTRYAVVPERYLMPLPEENPSELLTPIMCAGVTAYKALKVANVTLGSWIGVSGAAGGVGSLAVQYAKAMGYRTVAIDSGGGPQQRAICLEAGVDVYLDYEEAKPDLRTNLLRATGGDLSAAVLVCAGAATALFTYLFNLDVAYAIFRGQPPGLLLQELRFELPISNVCFQAPSADACFVTLRAWKQNTAGDHHSQDLYSVVWGVCNQSLHPFESDTLESENVEHVYNNLRSPALEMHLGVRGALCRAVAPWGGSSRVSFTRYAPEYWLLSSLVLNRLQKLKGADTGGCQRPSSSHGDQDDLGYSLDRSSPRLKTLSTEFRQLSFTGG